jgi:cohesin loading factor subunit SCC2
MSIEIFSPYLLNSVLNPYGFEPSSLSSPSSNYEASVYTEPVFHRPTIGPDYSIPPPPGITTSSSSLAYALGRPNPEKSRSTAKPEEPDLFLDPLSKTSQNLPRSTNQSTFQPSTPKSSFIPLPQESPDPLALLPFNPMSPLTPLTPLRKRKLVVEIDSSPIKRRNSTSSSKKMRASSVDPLNLPASSAKSHSRKNLAYVEVPPLSATWKTPSPSRRSCKSVGSQDMDMVDSPVDFSGYGSEDLSSPTRASVFKSSGRRTGDRDERGALVKLLCVTFVHVSHSSNRKTHGFTGRHF